MDVSEQDKKVMMVDFWRTSCSCYFFNMMLSIKSEWQSDFIRNIWNSDLIFCFKMVMFLKTPVLTQFWNYLTLKWWENLEGYLKYTRYKMIHSFPKLFKRVKIKCYKATILYLPCVDISFFPAFDEGNMIGSIRSFYLKITSRVGILWS